MRKNLADIMCLDIYLSNLAESEYDKIKHLLKPQSVTRLPIQSWDIYSEHYQNELQRLQRENDIREFKQLALKLKWKNNVDTIFADETFEALVVTNLNKEIIWVNNGFSAMTGYDKKFALNQTPAFLQGKGTDEATKERIRQKLATNQPFREVITNYRKDNTPYECELKIFPLYAGTTTHYLALERKAG